MTAMRALAGIAVGLFFLRQWRAESCRIEIVLCRHSISKCLNEYVYNNPLHLRMIADEVWTGGVSDVVMWLSGFADGHILHRTYDSNLRRQAAVGRT